MRRLYETGAIFETVHYGEPLRLPNQGHLDGPPIVAVLKDRVSGGGDGDLVDRLVGCRRDHTEEVAIGDDKPVRVAAGFYGHRRDRAIGFFRYNKPVRVAAGFYQVGGVLPVQEGILGRYGPDHTGNVRPIDGCTIDGDVPVAQVLVEGAGAVEHATHVGHREDVPASDITIANSRTM